MKNFKELKENFDELLSKMKTVIGKQDSDDSEVSIMAIVQHCNSVLCEDCKCDFSSTLCPISKFDAICEYIYKLNNSIKS